MTHRANAHDTDDPKTGQQLAQFEAVAEKFQGDISTRMTSGTRLILEDNYAGIGGWNPVSEQMAMDVLGIHVFKRFIKALNHEIEG